jgi:DNA polymerase/3'-5' exonuclease PolX
LQQKYANQADTIKKFTSYYDIGPKTANKFYEQGFRTIQDIYPHLNNSQKWGVYWSAHIAIPIPREEITEVDRLLYELLTHINGIQYTITGSYRRGAQYCGDIDVLVSNDGTLHMSQIITILKPYLPTQLSSGETKFAGIFRLDSAHNGHRIDIRLIDQSSYPTALMYFTGSGTFNVLMRERAQELGLKLSEYSLTNLQTGTEVPVTSEHDIFNVLHVEYYPPEARLKTLTSIHYTN